MTDEEFGKVIRDDANAARVRQVRVHHEPDRLIDAKFVSQAHQAQRTCEKMG